MRYKTSMPRDVRALVLAHVRGYERRLAALQNAKSEIMQAGRARGPTASVHRARRAGGDTERRALDLRQLEDGPDGASIRAVETALSAVGGDIQNEDIRRRLRAAILLNCRSGRDWPYERLNVESVGRDDFYSRRNLFLVAVARGLGYL